jgi:O-antigen/teichoic acid export membrane protein
MDSWFSRIRQFLGKDNISFYENILLKRGFSVLLIQFGGLAIVFASNILLARLYGEQAYGIYSLVSSWCMLLAVLGLFGMDDSHLVQLPAWKLKGENKKIRQQLKWSLGINLISIFVITAVFYFILHVAKLPRLSDYAYYFNYGFVLVLFLAIMNNLISFLRGMDKVIYGEIMDKMARPFFLIILLLVFYYLSKSDLVLDSLLAAAAGLFFILILLFFKIQKTVREIKGTGHESKKNYSLGPNFRYVFLNLLYFLSTRMDLLLLTLFSDAVLVGHYNVAVKFADVSSYPIAIINLSLPTLLSTVKHEKGQQAGPLLLHRVSKNSFFQCLLLSGLFVLTGNWILHWYGKGFGDAYPILLVFLLSNLITAFIGSADIYFVLEGRENRPIYSRIASLMLTIALAFFLIPKWQLMGAAVSMLLGNLLYCALMEYFFFARHRFFIHPFISGNKSAMGGKQEPESLG